MSRRDIRTPPKEAYKPYSPEKPFGGKPPPFLKRQNSSSSSVSGSGGRRGSLSNIALGDFSPSQKKSFTTEEQPRVAEKFGQAHTHG